MLFTDRFWLSVVLTDAPVSEAICSTMGSRAGESALGMCSGALLWKLLAGHLGKR